MLKTTDRINLGNEIALVQLLWYNTFTSVVSKVESALIKNMAYDGYDVMNILLLFHKISVRYSVQPVCNIHVYARY